MEELGLLGDDFTTASFFLKISRPRRWSTEGTVRSNGNVTDARNPDHRNGFPPSRAITHRTMSSLPERTDVDVEALRGVLRRHPVRLAVAFGSAVTGETHPRSDVDLAVEFDDTVDDAADAYMSLLADLGDALGRDDIDLGLVADLKPRVGLAAFEEGVLLVGTPDRFETHRDRFEDAVTDLERNRPSLRERFDAVIENVDEVLAEDP